MENMHLVAEAGPARLTHRTQRGDSAGTWSCRARLGTVQQQQKGVRLGEAIEWKSIQRVVITTDHSQRESFSQAGPLAVT